MLIGSVPRLCFVPRWLLFGLLALSLEARAQSSAPLDLTLHVAAAEAQRAGALSLALVLRNGDTEQMRVLRGQHRRVSPGQQSLPNGMT